jgi:hypothetical protein
MDTKVPEEKTIRGDIAKYLSETFHTLARQRIVEGYSQPPLGGS